MENAALLALPLFAGLPPAELPRALAALDARRRTFVKGEVLLEAGQHAVPMGVVLAGRVLVEHLDLWGNRTLLGRAAEGELFADEEKFRAELSQKCEMLRKKDDGTRENIIGRIIEAVKS